LFPTICRKATDHLSAPYARVFLYSNFADFFEQNSKQIIFTVTMADHSVSDVDYITTALGGSIGQQYATPQGRIIIQD
jgi:hypothetical protein